MTENRTDPTKRFDHLAGAYDRYRPDYPSGLLDAVIDQGSVTEQSTVVDVGSGTGIFTRLLAQRGLTVTGIEPSEPMRQIAESMATSASKVRYLAGRAEATGLADQSADLIVAAQAFHWFDAPKALTEFRRVLRNTGMVALIWNERDPRDPFTAGYGDVIRTSTEAVTQETRRQSAKRSLLDDERFAEKIEQSFPHEQRMSWDELVGRTFSMSYAPTDEPGREDWINRLRPLYDRFAVSGDVALRYRTTLVTARPLD